MLNTDYLACLKNINFSCRYVSYIHKFKLYNLCDITYDKTIMFLN